MTIKGMEVEVKCKPRNLSKEPLGNWKKGCLDEDGTFVGCEDPNFICLRNYPMQFSQCRNKDRNVSTRWKFPRAIVDANDEANAVYCNEHELEEDDEPEPEPAPEHKHEPTPAPAPEHMLEHEPTPTPTPTPEHAHDEKDGMDSDDDKDRKDGKDGKEHDHSKHDHSCDDKCSTAAECAVESLWRCADKTDPIAQACSAGSQCFRKNKFYAVCLDLTQEGGRRKALDYLEDREWDMTVIPCGENIETYRTDLFCKRDECFPQLTFPEVSHSHSQ